MGNTNAAGPKTKTPKHGGSLVYMFKDDPGNEDTGATIMAPVWLPGGLKVGDPPLDVKEFDVIITSKCLFSEDVVMGGFRDLPPIGESGNYAGHPAGVTYGASGVAIIQTVLTMYRRALKRMGVMDHFTWKSGNQLLFFPKFKNFYKIGGQIAFYVGEVDFLKNRNFIACATFEEGDTDADGFTGSAMWFDAVAHEAGHGVLHSLRPAYFRSSNKQTHAFDESFGDITGLLAQISQLDICEKAIVYAKGDLHTKTFFTKSCEQMGEVLLGRDCMRNADNDLAIDEVTEEEHDLSQVFTGAFYDIMVDVYDDMTDLSMYNPAIILYKTGEHMMEVLIRSIIDQPSDTPSLADMARSMMDAEKNEKYRGFMQTHFDRRKLFDPTAKPKPEGAEVEKSATAKPRTAKCGSAVDVKVVMATADDA